LLMSNSNRKNNTDSSSINTKQVLITLVVLGFLIVGFYFFNFNFHLLKNEDWGRRIFQNFARDTDSWGTFGDYVGGILNPVIAAFAFYLIAKTYELQRELSDAQKNQIKLAALTALLNSNLMRIDMLKAEKISLQQGILPAPISPKTQEEDRKQAIKDLKDSRRPADEVRKEKIKARLDEIESEISDLIKKHNQFEKEIKTFLEQLN
jgi:heme/copper-type cytochrome/quinol oxidase subunit 1